jgi:hypothetical protein
MKVIFDLMSRLFCFVLIYQCYFIEDIHSSQNSLDGLGMPESYEQPEDIFSMDKIILRKKIENSVLNINISSCNQ